MIVTNSSPKSKNGILTEMIQYALAKNFGITETKKQHFLRQNMIVDMQSQDEIAVLNAQNDQIKYEFAKKALIFSGKYGITLQKENHVRYGKDLALYLKESSEIDPTQYENYVKIIKTILSKSQFDRLKEFI